MVTPPGPETPTAAGKLEETGYVPSGDGSIYCFVSMPAGRNAHCAAVLLGPFAEEKKSSLRPLVEMAREMAAAGFTAVRLDFRGTGDASGPSEELSVESMVEDALSAVAFARSECGAKRVALVGLRLGGAVAVLAAGRARADALVLVEPVVSGAAYVKSLSRQQAIRRMLTSGSGRKSRGQDNRGQDNRGQDNEEGPLDLDGLAMGRGFLAGLEKVDVTRAAVELRSDPSAAALVLQVGPRARPSRKLAVLAEALGGAARLEAVVARPFWLQTDYVDPAPVTARVLDFMGSAFGALHGDGEEADSE